MPHTPTISGTSEDVYELAKRKARYGRSPWAVWKDRLETFHASPVTTDSIRAAMLATGTSGRWTMIPNRSTVFMCIHWSEACILFRNVRRFGSSIL